MNLSSSLLLFNPASSTQGGGGGGGGGGLISAVTRLARGVRVAQDSSEEWTLERQSRLPSIAPAARLADGWPSDEMQTGPLTLQGAL